MVNSLTDLEAELKSLNMHKLKFEKQKGRLSTVNRVELRIVIMRDQIFFIHDSETN